MTAGTKVRTLYHYSDTGVICRPRKSKGEGVPGPDWFVVKLDGNGGRMCIHRSMLAVRNQ